jgi:hypothetical protein
MTIDIRNWDDMIDLHLAAFDGLIDQEDDEAKKACLIRARQQLTACCEAAQRLGDGDGQKIQRLSLRAEECRTLADHCESEIARRTYLQMAIGFEKLAHRLGQHPPPRPWRGSL